MTLVTEYLIAIFFLDEGKSSSPDGFPQSASHQGFGGSGSGSGDNITRYDTVRITCGFLC